MGAKIEQKRCVLLGSAPADQREREFMKTQIRGDDFLVCADGGYETAAGLGKKPDLLIGDLDSCVIDLPAGVELIRLPEKKDDTDMMYSIKECLKRGYRDFLLLGATGGRLDHTVANFSALYYLARNGARGVLADWQNEVILAREGRIDLNGEPGDLVSVFPYSAPYCTVTYKGLEYPLDHYRLYSWDPMGISNQMTGTHAVITIHEGPVLLVLSKENEKVCTNSPLPRKIE